MSNRLEKERLSQMALFLWLLESFGAQVRPGKNLDSAINSVRVRNKFLSDTWHVSVPRIKDRLALKKSIELLQA